MAKLGPPALLPGRGRTSIFTWIRLRKENPSAVFQAGALDEDVIETKFLWSHGFMVNHPDGIQHVLVDRADNYVKSRDLALMLRPLFGRALLLREGESWRSHRRLMAPWLHGRSLESHVPVMAGRAAELAQSWSRLAPGTEIDVSSAMTKLTAEIIFEAMFSRRAGPAIAQCIGRIPEYEAAAVPNLLDLLRVPDRIAGIRRRALARRLFQPIWRLLEDTLEERRRLGPGEADDLAGRLLAQEEKDPTFTREDILGELMGMFIGGHESTAISLAWTWYLLSLHPEAAGRMEAELRSILGGRNPGPEDVPKLVYTTMVLKESLRLFPPFFSASGRRALADDEVCGRRVPAGAYVAIVPWIIHRHRRLWEDPDRFDPERFSEARSAHRHRYAFVPFSAGPRNCLGASFAMTEAVVILATLAQRVRLLPPKTERPVETRGFIALRPRPPITLAVEPARP